ncbi:MAG: DUF1553 domain-containing protein, partial [Candidatus Hydrogenedentes bacterium]|nr:DUF1553 domain-containing protein [Candidatus Hydrogenedentota bacterium]
MFGCEAILVCVVALCLGVAPIPPAPGGAAAHWAFQAIGRPEVPPAAAVSWVRNPIDTFVLARLVREGIQPSPEADGVTLLRRLSIDLIGLPPTLEEVDAFRGEEDKEAYGRLVDRLLASPHFGEKWARWWLDLSAYADSDGYLSDFLRPNAWRYRQWVVDAFNANQPFDQFTIEQLAGDLLPTATVEQRIATGFNRNTLSNREGGADLEEFRVKQIVARTSNVGTAWLGLTLGCAECHDHKFDPIAQREFYGLYAFFNSTDEINVDAPLGDERARYAAARPAYEQKRAALLAPVAQEVASLQTEWERRMLEAADHPETADYRWARQWEILGLIWGQNFGEGQLEGTLIVRTPVPERTPAQRERLLDYFLQNGAIVNESTWSELKLDELSKQLEAWKLELPVVGRAPALSENAGGRTTRVHQRGDFRAPGGEAPPGTPAVLPPLGVEGRATRLDLARWLVRRDNPLTARVTVNRVWQELFGRGLVLSTEDFGARGTPPSHPELLDWLAAEFIDSGWDIKHLLKVIVSSATYRQSSKRRGELNALDPGNVLLARQARVRLSAEGVRDAALLVSGLLNPQVGGPSVRPPQPASVSMEGFMNEWKPSEGQDRYRRGLYTWIQRTSPYGQLVTFDLPDPGRPCTRRERSNTPLQALNLLNDPVFVEAAQALAERVQAFALEAARERGGASVEQCLDYAFRRCLARAPHAEERARLKQYLEQQVRLFEEVPEQARLLLAGQGDPTASVEPAAWTALASVLLNLDEF